MTGRIALLAVVLFMGAAAATRANKPEDVAVRRPLAELPLTIASWQGRDTGRFTAAVERVLQADDYVNRLYVKPGETPVSMYVGYHASQRQGTAIHSPLNCLPGAGWTPVERSQVDLPIEGKGTIRVNRFVIEKGLDRQVVLYWYQSHGRVIASEYWGKAFMVYDAVRLNRTDAALVRFITPVAESDDGGGMATARVTRFAQALFPMLGAYLP